MVVEVVPYRPGKRNYEDKPGEYPACGVEEYWIVDVPQRQFTAMTRYRGQWRANVSTSKQRYTTTCLTGFSLDLKPIFAAT